VTLLQEGRPGALVPLVSRVVDRRVEADDVVTLAVEPVDGTFAPFRAGQFNMLCAFGVGEVPISISSAPGSVGPLEHTVRDVGAVTRALCAADVGSLLGVRGPYGTAWDVEDLGDSDVVVVAGGIGLAPLRGATDQVVSAALGGGPGGPAGSARTTVLVGARSPDQVIFPGDLERWAASGAEVEVTVDVAPHGWRGSVGVVTNLISARGFEGRSTVALLCGPEVMIRFCARALLDKGLPPESIRVSLERNMQCGAALCGHCQLGPLLLCRDGPVVDYARVAGILTEHDL
jgi:anaerobic sulfite reductase subunit B